MGAILFPFAEEAIHLAGCEDETSRIRSFADSDWEKGAGECGREVLRLGSSPADHLGGVTRADYLAILPFSATSKF